jgi:glycosyltransferase involved in cell wall biosynthesis
MLIRVAYDISNLASDFGRPDAKTGINRVVHEVLDEISKRHDLEVTAVALYGHPLRETIRASLYLANTDPPLNCGFDYTFHVRPGLTKAYQAVFRAAQLTPPERMPVHSPRGLYLRCLRSALSRMANYRVVSLKRVFDQKKFHVFHCPHLILSPKSITGDLPRVITIYDLIPLVKPEFVSAFQSVVVKTLLDGIDVERDWVICISEFTKMEFCERTGMSPERVMVVPLAADRFFRPVTDPNVIAATRLRYQIPEGEYLFCLAAPQPRKNLGRLIPFVLTLTRRRAPARYVSRARGLERTGLDVRRHFRCR